MTQKISEQAIAAAKTFLGNGGNKEALEALDEIASIESDNVLVARMRALANYNLAEYKKAADILKDAISHVPEEIELYIDICACYFALEDHQLGLIFALKGLEKDKENPRLLRGYALILKCLGRIDESIAVLSGIISKNPKDIESLKILGNIYSNIFADGAKAIECFERIIKIDPNNYKIRLRICDTLTRSTQGSEADNIAHAYKIATELLEMPKNEIAITAQYIFLKVLDYENYNRLGDFKEMMEIIATNDALLPLILSMGRVKTMQDRYDLLEAFRQWGNKKSEKDGKSVVCKTRRNLSKKVRIGMVLANMYSDHVFHFIRPIIEHLDKSKFELYNYSLSPMRSNDPLQHIIKDKSEKLRTYFLSESEHKVAQDMADDGLDLLLETGIVFLKPKLLTYKAAPVQVSWLECPHSNGLPSDYILVDPYINPGQELLLEKPFILPQTWVSIDERRFSPHVMSNEIPQDRNGYITFGTMNSTFKLTTESFRVWAEIMNMLPNSRFLYVRPEAVSLVLQANFCKYMAQYGVSSDRISFVSTRTQHLDQYHNIDIAFDTFPHTGGTTTCESLWMGVPVVTLVGPSFFERLSYSNLSNAGLGDLCAFSIKEYQGITLQLASDKQRRRYLKANLRKQVMANPLGQPRQFVKDVENAILDVLGRD